MNSSNSTDSSEFENVPIPDGNSFTPASESNNSPLSNSQPDNSSTPANENSSVSTEPFGASEAPASNASAVAAPSAFPVPVPVSMSMSKSGKPMSTKQSDLQKLRAETLDDMRQKYAARFSGYDKPPKAKAYHAAGLTTIRQRDGETAYTAALNKIMNSNDPRMGSNGKSLSTAARKTAASARKTAKAGPNASANTRRNNNRMASALRQNNTNWQNVEVKLTNKNINISKTPEAVNTMAETAISIIKRLQATAKRYMNNSKGAATSVPTRKPRKPKEAPLKPLSTVAENNGIAYNNL